MPNSFHRDAVEMFAARPLPVTWLNFPVRIMRVSCNDACGDPPPGESAAHGTRVGSDSGVLGWVVDTQDEDPG